MTFLETPRFPDRISLNAEGGPEWSTRIVALKSGHEQRNAEWAASRLRYNIATAIRDQGDRDEIIAWMRALQGQAHAFRFRDPMDNSATTSSGYFAASGEGDGLPSAQMRKRYAVGSLAELRDIRKPVSGSVAIEYDGSPLTSPAPSVDTTTGIVTFGAFDSSAVTAVTPGATTDVTLGAALTGLLVGQRLYLSGITGTIATVLNGVAHTITGIASSTYTLSVNTTGLAYTSGGTGAYYPQPGKTLRWSGAFDVPVRFGTDAMRLFLETGDFQRWNEIPLLEVRE